MRATRIDGPLVLPVSLVEAKAHLRVDHNDDDSLISALTDSAVGYLEGSGTARDGVLGRVMIEQTWRVDTDRPVDGRIWIEPGPVTSLESIVAIKNGVETSENIDDFRLGFDGTRAFVVSNDGVEWPDCDRCDDAIRITFVAGYGSAASDVPAPLRTAILLLVGHLYAHRSGVTTGAPPPVELPFGISMLIAPFRVIPV